MQSKRSKEPITLEIALKEATKALKKNRALAPKYVRHLVAQLVWYRGQAQVQAEQLDLIESALNVGQEHADSGWHPIAGEEVFAEALVTAVGGNQGRHAPILRLIPGGVRSNEDEEDDGGGFPSTGDIA